MVVLNPQFRLTIVRGNGSTAYIRGLASARVKMTKKKPADECELEFPNVKDFTFDLFNKGDDVELYLGYKEFGVYPVFLGKIKKIEPNLPLKLSCEGSGAASRKGAYTRTYANAGWKDIAADALMRSGLVPRPASEMPTTEPPATFRVDNETPAEVLDTCARETGWSWYAVPGTKDGYFGPRDQEPKKSKRIFRFTVGENAYGDDCQLEYQSTRKIKKVIVTLVDANYEKPPATAEFQAGDYKPGDPEKRLKFPVSNPTETKARERAEQEYYQLSIKGFKGSFKAVGNPLIKQGSKIALVVPKFDDNVRYATVENVEHALDNGAYNITIEIGGGEK